MNTEPIFVHALLNFAKQYWWLILLIIGLRLLGAFVPKIKGRVGEGLVNTAAKLRLDSSVYHLIKDVTVPTKRGTTQIDHIIVSKFGLFVVETKNHKGWIFADAKSPKWTQVHFKQKHQFQNPLRQNYAHICALSELLDLPKEKIHGIVCFMGDAKFKKGIPEGVFLEGRYITHIKSFQTPVFSDADVSDLIQRIESVQLERGFKTNRAHIQQLKTQHKTGGRRFVAAGSDRAEPSSNGSAKRCARNAERKWCCAPPGAAPTPAISSGDVRPIRSAALPCPFKFSLFAAKVFGAFFQQLLCDRLFAGLFFQNPLHGLNVGNGYVYFLHIDFLSARS